MNRDQHATQHGHSGNRVVAVGKIENELADPHLYNFTQVRGSGLFDILSHLGEA